LRVADNVVYFEVTANTVASANAPATTTFTTTARTVPIGFLMSVVPQISDTDTVLLNLRPTISRLVRYVSDPNPSLGAVPNLVPETQTREMESLLRVQSGQTAVLGGLIQDDARNTDDGSPGINRVPGLGELFRQRQDSVRKTELVIFLRPTVIRDPSIDGDYRRFRDLLPDADFLRRPNPGKVEAYGERPER
jgi:type II secretory pathway component GspD/PulD (secretin)